MTKKDLKLMAGEIIKESEYSISAKKQLLNYVLNEDNESQIKSLILDGGIESLEEDAVEIVNKRFDILFENIIKQNLTETQEFIEIGRDTICDIIESQSSSYDEESYENMINFVVNEATDFQILSMLVEDKLPEIEYDEEKCYSLTESINNFAGTTFMLTEAPASAVIDKKITDIVNKLRKWAHTKGPEAMKRKREYMHKLGILKRDKAAAAKSTAAMAASVPGRHTTKTLTLGQAAKGAAAKAAGAAKSAAGAVGKFATTPAGQAIGGLAAAALVSYAAYKIYKNFFSKAARACKGSPDKGACMKQYKNKAIQAQISKLSSGASSCAKSKDPAKCKAAIQSKIAKLRSKISG